MACPQICQAGAASGSAETFPSAVRPVRLAGRELLLARLHSGRVVAALVHCPHLGAYLGHGGTVAGESIRCPFHGLMFDGTAGQCTSNLAPARMALNPITIVEQHSVILGWHHRDQLDPPWRVADLDMSSGWAPGARAH